MHFHWLNLFCLAWFMLSIFVCLNVMVIQIFLCHLYVPEESAIAGWSFDFYLPSVFNPLLSYLYISPFQV